MAVVGIDIGTTYSCVAVWRNGQVDVIANDYGSRTTPSFVAFTSTERLIGEPARNQIASNPWNTVFGAKRLIGRRYDDIGVQMDLRHWPFKVINDNGKPMILVEFKGERKKFAPEQITAMIIFQMKQIAENYLKCKVDKAVITVPAYFNNSQRQATRTAAAIAGLKVLRITNEPTAAALAYGLDRNLKGERNFFIYDLGGGTFDVSVLTLSGGSTYEVKSTAGNTRLGGEDFDNRLVAYFIEDFRNRFKIEVSANTKALRRLKTTAEITKKFLTSALEATVEVDSLCGGIDYRGKVTREMFEELCSDLFTDTLKPIRQALQDAKMSKKDINSVVVVGGSTRIPKIRAMLKEMFNGRVLTAINPEEAVAIGAAIQAAAISGGNHEKIQDMLLLDVVPLSLGVETGRGVMYKVIERNTPIPCSKTKDITTLEDNQNCMTIEVFEGERSLTKDNNLLGVFELSGIPPAPRGVAKIDITFDVDVNGVLSVYAQDRITGNTKSLAIKNECRLNHQDVGKMIADAEAFKEEDQENRLRLEARNQLETYVFGVKQTVNEKRMELSQEERAIMLKECQEAESWLDDNTDCIREEFERKITEYMMQWSTIMKKFYDNSLWHRAKRQRLDNYPELHQHEFTSAVLEVND